MLIYATQLPSPFLHEGYFPTKNEMIVVNIVKVIKQTPIHLRWTDRRTDLTDAYMCNWALMT